MRTIDLVDPELRAALDQRPRLKLNSDVLERSRAFIVSTAAAAEKPELPGLEVSELFLPSAFDGRLIRVLGYRPAAAQSPLPAVVHVHGGGFVMGVPEMKDLENRSLAYELNCAIYSVDYRLAPEAPFPAALQDVYSVIVWLHQKAGELGLNAECIGIKGESGGGGIAAGTALYARDQQGPRLAFQHLFYPMIDDRTAVRQDLNPFVGEFVWTREHNLFGWSSLLGAAPGSGDVSPYAAAARATDLAGLPPTFLAVGGLDLFLDENIDYANRLSRAGVAVEFHLYPGAYHGFQSASQARVSQQSVRDSRDALCRLLHG